MSSPPSLLGFCALSGPDPSSPGRVTGQLGMARWLVTLPEQAPHPFRIP